MMWHQISSIRWHILLLWTFLGYFNIISLWKITTIILISKNKTEKTVRRCSVAMHQILILFSGLNMQTRVAITFDMLIILTLEFPLFSICFHFHFSYFVLILLFLIIFSFFDSKILRVAWRCSNYANIDIVSTITFLLFTSITITLAFYI